jgi:hypothetical protein
MLSITSHQGNTNQNHSEMSLHDQTDSKYWNQQSLNTAVGWNMVQSLL